MTEAEEIWPEPKIAPMPSAIVRRIEFNSNTIGAAGVGLVDVAIGALVSLMLGVIVGVLVAMLLLGLVLCRVAWALQQWEHADEHDEDQPPWPLRQAS